jgi:hypothetical protein
MFSSSRKRNSPKPQSSTRRNKSKSRVSRISRATATRYRHGGGGFFSGLFKKKIPVIKIEDNKLSKSQQLKAEDLAELAELDKMIQEEDEAAAAAAEAAAQRAAAEAQRAAAEIERLISKPLPGSVTLTPEQEALELAELEKLANNGGTRKRYKYKKHKKHKKH